MSKAGLLKDSAPACGSAAAGAVSSARDTGGLTAPAIAGEAVDESVGEAVEFQLPFREPFLASLPRPLILSGHLDDWGGFKRRAEISKSEFVKPAIVTCAADDGEFQLPFREPSRTSTAGPVILASHVDEGGSVERALPIASPPAFATPLLLMRNVEVPDGPRQ